MRGNLQVRICGGPEFGNGSGLPGGRPAFSTDLWCCSVLGVARAQPGSASHGEGTWFETAHISTRSGLERRLIPLASYEASLGASPDSTRPLDIRTTADLGRTPAGL
jgi:hypothetical protein